MSGDIKKDIRSEARNFSASLTSVYLGKKRDPQSKNLLEKAQQLIDGLLAEAPARQVPATPPPRIARGGAGMGQLWVKLDELKRENDDLKRQRARSSDDKAGSPKSPKSPKTHAPPGQSESMTTDIQRFRGENEALRGQVDKLQKCVKEHQVVNASLQDEYKRLRVALEAAQKSAMRAREDTKKLELSLQALKSENEALKHKSHTCSIWQLSRLLPSCHGTFLPTSRTVQAPAPSAPQAPTAAPRPIVNSPKPRARTDNRLTENISEKCRPTNIALAYTTLESQEWMDAKESLEECSGDEHHITTFLCTLLLKSYQISLTVLQSVEKLLAHVLANPTSAISLLASGIVTTNIQLSEDVSDMVCQKLRASFDNINTRDLAELTREAVESTSPLISEWSNPAVQSYVQQCGAVTWQMVVQKPAMKLSHSDTIFDGGKHKLWWSCEVSKARKIDYFVWPVLFDYDGGNMMVKGCVHAS